MLKLSKFYVFLFVFMLIAQPLFAATISEDIQNQLLSVTKIFDKEAKKTVQTLPTKKPEIVEKIDDKPNLEAPGPVFFIKTIKIEGNTVFSTEIFRQYAKDFENRQLSFNDLRTLAQLITFHYRSKGYTTSRAYLPPQKIENETATIRILEGKISRILVDGNGTFPTYSYVDSIHLRKDRIFRYSDLEISLYELNEKADRHVKAYLEPSDVPGESDIILKTKEDRVFHPFFEFNNHGTKLTHLSRYNSGFIHNNLTNHADSLRTYFSYAEQAAIQAAAVSYSFPIERTGTLIQINTSYAETSLAKHLRPLHVDGTSLSFSPSITQNFIRYNNFKLTGQLSFEIEDSKTTLDGDRLNYDRTRAIVIGPQMTFWDAMSKTVLNLALHYGVPNLFGGLRQNDPDASRSNIAGAFTTYTAQASRIQRLPFLSTFIIMRGGAQWTKDSLVSLQQFHAGGAYSVRGYPESDSQGDYGYNFTGEMNFPLIFIDEKWRVPFTNKKWKDTLIATTFIDGAKTFLRERDDPTQVKDKFLLGTGVGFKVYVNENVTIQADLGIPLGDRSSDNNRVQLHLLTRAEW